MIRLGPWKGHRRGWLVVAAAGVFGILGGSAGMAVTTPQPEQVPVVVPAGRPVSTTPDTHVPTSMETVKQGPTPTVVVTSVVKVYVAPSTEHHTVTDQPSEAPRTPWRPTRRPYPTPTPTTPSESSSSPSVGTSSPAGPTTPAQPTPDSGGTPAPPTAHS